jgi:S1-C subfamily serine protease
MTYFYNYLVKFLFISLLLTLNQCSDPAPREMTKGHIDAVKEQCKNDPDKKLCGKEVRLKFKRDGHKYVSLDELDKSERNRVAFNCADQKEYGLVAYNECLREKKQLALGNNLTNQDGEPPITSNLDKIKQRVFYIVAFNDGDVVEEGYYTGSGVAISKNLIATNCHVILDKEATTRAQKVTYLDTILVENLHDKNKSGQVYLEKDGTKNNLDICILKTKSELKYVKKKVAYSRLKQRDKVLAVGNPQGIKGHISDGRITALENDKMYAKSFINTKDGKITAVKLKKPHKIVHHDSATGQGSSGGPLFDVGGNLIGINTWIIDEGISGGFGLALSADHINDVLRD